MTEEVNVHAEVSEVEDNRDVELENDHALEKEEEVIDNGDLKEDADGSYVFVSESGVVAAEDDPVESDLNVGDCLTGSNGGENVASYSVDNNGAASEGSGDPGENAFPIDHPHDKFDGERVDVDDPIEELPLRVSQEVGSEATECECERQQFTEKDCSDGSVVYAGPVEDKAVGSEATECECEGQQFAEKDCSDDSVVSAGPLEDNWETKTNSIISAGGENIGRESESQSVLDVKESKGFENVVCAHVQNGLGEEAEMREYVESVGAESESVSVRDVKESQQFNNLVGSDVKIGSGEVKEPSEYSEYVLLGNESVSVTHEEEGSQQFNNLVGADVVKIGSEEKKEPSEYSENVLQGNDSVSVTYVEEESQQFNNVVGADVKIGSGEEKEPSEYSENVLQGNESVSVTYVEDESQQFNNLVGADVKIGSGEEKEPSEYSENVLQGNESVSVTYLEVESQKFNNNNVGQENELQEYVESVEIAERESESVTVPEHQEFKIVAGADAQNLLAEDKELSECVGGIPVEGKPGSAEEESVQDLATNSCNVANMMVETEEKELSECIGEIPVKGKSGSKLGSVEEKSVQELSTDSCNVGDMMIETVITNGTVSNEHSTGYIQDRGSADFDSNQVAGEHNLSSESIDCDLGSNGFMQGASLQNGSVESVKTSSVPLNGENASIESNECDIHDEKVEGFKSSPACIMDEGGTGTESGTLRAKTSGITDSNFVPERKFEIESDDSLLVDNNEPTSPSDHARTHGGTSSIESSASGGKLDNDAETDVKSPANNLTENRINLCNCSVADVELVPEKGNTSTLSSMYTPEDGNVTSDKNDNAVVSEGTPSFDVPVNSEGDQFTSFDGPKEAGVASGMHGDENLRHIEEGSTVDITDGQNMDAEVGKRPLRPFYFLIRPPRYDDENIREQIKYAQFLVDEKTKSRDAIRAEIQIKKAACKECSQDVEAAKSAERAARDVLKSKRQEMDSVQSMVNRLNNAISVDDIDGRIRNMEHMIEHETLPLKEEKQLLRQIKQLKQHREELSSNIGKQDELQQSLDHKDGIEEQFKRLQLLRKEVELLRHNVVKAEAVTKAAKKRYDEEYCKLSELLAQFKAADDIRQEAYAKLQVLRKELYEKTKYFRDYKIAANKATELVAEGKREELQCFCVDQVERIMELWNKNDEFRSDYVRCNIRSTLRRLRTLDGRSLGPDEEPPVIPNVFNERASKNNFLSLHSTLEQEKKVVSAETVKIEDEIVSKVEAMVERSQTTRTKKPAKPAPVEKSLVMVSSSDDAEGVKEEPMRTKEEEERVLKAEEIRKEEEAVKLKEKRRLDEMAKANEAMQRKKRIADKAQQRAALRAQKEAEQKEKEREKRARKKERRKVAAIDTSNNEEGGSAAPISETLPSSMEECDLGDKQVEVTKKLQKPSQFIKQTKAKSIPLPLRNRGKRRMQLWMWVLITILVVVALFFVGNRSFSLRSGLQGSGF